MDIYKGKASYWMQPFGHENTEGFGPVGGDEESRFRLTTRYQVDTGSGVSHIQAFAVSQGWLMIFEDSTDSSKVNLVLKPISHSMHGVHIAYFIYRGIQKSDIASGGSLQDDIPAIASAIQAYSELNDGATLTLAKLGYDAPGVTDDVLLSDLFRRSENESFSGPTTAVMVRRGMHIGNFIGDYGFEVIRFRDDFSSANGNPAHPINVGFARANDNVLDVTTYSGTYSEKLYREAVVNYIDPICFLGMHASDSAELYLGISELVDNEMFYNVLIEEHLNKGRSYISILSDIGRSFNYFGNYDSWFQEGEPGVPDQHSLSALSDTDQDQFLDKGTFGWPILVYNDILVDEENQLNLKIRISSKFTVDTVLYASSSLSSQDEEKGYFALADDLFSEDEYYTRAIELLDDHYQVEIGTDLFAWRRVPSHHEILFTGNFRYRNSTSDTPTAKLFCKPIDELFPLIPSPVVASSNSDSSFSSVYPALLNMEMFMASVGHSFGRFGIALSMDSKGNPEENVAPIDRIWLVAHSSDSFSSDVKGIKAIREDSLSSPLRTKLTSTGNSIEVLRVKTPVWSIKALKWTHEVNGGLYRFGLGMSKSEYMTLCDLAAANGLVNARIFFEDLAEDLWFLSEPVADNAYQKLRYKYYTSVVSGENNSGDVVLVRPSVAIPVYTIDGFIYFTEAYSSPEKVNVPDYAKRDRGANIEYQELDN